jgi:hypothetical protein
LAGKSKAKKPLASSELMWNNNTCTEIYIQELGWDAGDKIRITYGPD